ncbi:MAG TPA: hypothetical protein VH165_23695 [Kofleriaceae bacterium]|nr:hypothetical protein [Kofleriaceae bacterium]
MPKPEADPEAKAEAEGAEAGAALEPAKADAAPAKAGAEPAKADAEPAKADAAPEPAEADGEPAKAEPAKADAEPAKAGAEPAGDLPPAKVLRDNLKPRPETKDATKDTAKASAKDEPSAPAQPSGKPGGKKSRARKADDLEIELEASRQRSISWTVIGGIIGCLLIWKLGTVGVWGGFVLVAFAVYHAWNLVQTLLYPPGTIVISEREVSLPRGLSMPRPVTAPRGEVTAVYFLRRSVPWNHAAPVLIVELGERAMAFPRDWFASESDQRRVVQALLRDLPKASAAAAAPREPAA